VCYSVLQCVAACCSALHSCDLLQLARVAELRREMLIIAVCCSVLQCDVVCCSVLQRVAVCCSVLHSCDLVQFACGLSLD